MKDRTDSAGDWTRIRQVMINNEDLFLNGDGMPVSSEYELGQCENNGIDLNEILDSIRSIMEEPFDAECVKSKLLPILLDEKKRRGLEDGTPVDDFIARVQGGEFGEMERDEMAAKCVLILGWHDYFGCWTAEQLCHFLDELLQT